MKTSGASTETAMTVAVCCIALGLLVAIGGGPSEVLRVLDRAIRSLADALIQAYQSFRV
jgi:hypothetical protein